MADFLYTGDEGEKWVKDQVDALSAETDEVKKEESSDESATSTEVGSRGDDEGSGNGEDEVSAPDESAPRVGRDHEGAGQDLEMYHNYVWVSPPDSSMMPATAGLVEIPTERWTSLASETAAQAYEKEVEAERAALSLRAVSLYVEKVVVRGLWKLLEKELVQNVPDKHHMPKYDGVTILDFLRRTPTEFRSLLPVAGQREVWHDEDFATVDLDALSAMLRWHSGMLCKLKTCQEHYRQRRCWWFYWLPYSAQQGLEAFNEGQQQRKSWLPVSAVSRITMASRKQKAAADVRAGAKGDKVLCFSGRKGSPGLYITSVQEARSNQLCYLYLGLWPTVYRISLRSHCMSPRTLYSVDGQLLWAIVEGKGAWAVVTSSQAPAVRQLKAGDLLVQHTGEALVVTRIEPLRAGPETQITWLQLKGGSGTIFLDGFLAGHRLRRWQSSLWDRRRC